MTEQPAWEPQRRARRRALQALYQWQITGQPAQQIVEQFLETQDFGGVDTQLFKTLVAGVIDLDNELGDRLQPCMNRPLEQCDVMERVILLLGAWQLENSPQTPYQVVLDESVELARMFGSGQSYSYINAVLDRFAHAGAGGGDHE